MSEKATIIYTHTDGAPPFATYSLFANCEGFAQPAGMYIETHGISLAGHILAAFSEKLPDAQKVNDSLAELGELVKKPQSVARAAGVPAVFWLDTTRPHDAGGYYAPDPAQASQAMRPSKTFNEIIDRG